MAEFSKSSNSACSLFDVANVLPDVDVASGIIFVEVVPPIVGVEFDPKIGVASGSTSEYD